MAVPPVASQPAREAPRVLRAGARLGFGCIVASETEGPIMLVNLV
jgi:hypothetical protein